MTTGPMTPGDSRADTQDPGRHDFDGHDTDAKLSLQRRQQLSALVDGDLAPDQARFLLRRLGHDPELVGRWQRWQLAGDVLRGQPLATLPGGANAFAAQVAAAVSREGARPGGAGRPRWQHVAALAASVAVVALFVTRPLGDSELAGAPPEVVAVIEAPAAPPAVAPAIPEPPAVEPVREVSVPQFAEAAPPSRIVTSPETTVATATETSRGRRVAMESPSRDAAATPTPTPDRADIASTLVLAASDASPSDARPFANPDEPQARPWPRATLPELATPDQAGRFSVGFGDSARASYSPLPSFYPFEPQLPVGQPVTGAEAAAGDPASDPERTP